MPFPANCPVCKTLLAFPDVAPANPIRCPVCNTRFMMEGRRVAHLAFSDYYSLLEVPPEAETEELRKAIRARILQWHPDRNPDDPGASDKVREVIQAKELLTDPQKRATYDRVYFAQALPPWTGAARRATADYSRRPRTPPQPGVRDARTEGPGQRPYSAGWGDQTYAGTGEQEAYSDARRLYEEMMARARARSATMAGHGMDQILREMEQRAWWGSLGAGIGCLVGAAIGFGVGRVIGAAILGVLGMIIGRMFGTYAREVGHLIIFLVRVFIYGHLLRVLVLALGPEAWGQTELPGIVTACTYYAVVGAAALGVLSIGSTALMGRLPRFAHIGVLMQASIGAWVGALAGLAIAAIGGRMEDSPAPVGIWFAIFTLVLIVDVYIFARPWVIVLTDRIRYQ